MNRRQGLTPEVARLVATYLDQDRKAAIDWADPTARAAQLQVLAADAEAALDAILPASDDAEVRMLGWLLTKILGDDLVTDAHGQVQLGEGTAPERTPAPHLRASQVQVSSVSPIPKCITAARAPRSASTASRRSS